MKSIPALVVAICIAHVSNAGGFVPPDGPKPILTFTQTEPWALVIGADIPRVAVYENREVIFSKRVGKKLVYHHATLDKTTFDRLQELMKPILNFDQLDTSYDVSGGWTDQPEARFYLRDGKRERVTCVYGLICDAEQETSDPGKKLDSEATAPPRALLALHQRLCGFDVADSKEWTPKYIEVMVWDFSYAPDASIQWPKDWPSLESDRTFKHEGDMHSIFLDGTMLAELQRFLATRMPKGAVEFSGKKMSVSCRLVVPGEMATRRAFQAAWEAAAEAAQRAREANSNPAQDQPSDAKAGITTTQPVSAAD